MSAINDGGPAFPRDERHQGHNGMSLRDWFAGQALAGLSANSVLTNEPYKMVAEMAYRQADAMLAVRAAMAQEGKP